MPALPGICRGSSYVTNTNMNYHWNWSIFHEQVKGGDETYLDWLLTGFGWTAAVSLSVSEIAFIENDSSPDGSRQ